MAKNDSGDMKLGLDVKEVESGLRRINEVLSQSDGEIKNLNKGFLQLKSKGTSSIKQTAEVINNMTQRMKEMSLQLKNIQNQFTGSFKALERQAAFRGMKTGSLNDNKIWAAQIEKLNVQNRELINTYSQVARKIDLVNTKIASLNGSYANQRAEIRRLNNELLYGTKEGERSLKYDYAVKKENILRKSRNQTLLESGVSTETIKDLNQMESLDRRLGAIQIKLMANYKAINLATGAFKYLLNYTVEYDKELHQLQAIAAVSDTTMLKLKDSIQAVASSTKFTSLEVAQAGTVLAQAGLSARQIEETLPAIAKLATATGTDLATSTDVVTSTLNIYSLQASEAEHVTNALTTAMNESKADIGGFQKAIQYAGNYAAQLGVTYEETAAVISAATQAGIRSRSMLGTGLRAVLAEFLNPTKKLTAQLEKVGLTVSDIDVRSKGLSNVLKTLKDAGFGATEAFRGMERRGAAFLASIIKQTDFIDTLREHMASSTAATEANEIQMSSLSAQIANFKSIAGTAATEGVAPLNKMLVLLLKTVNSLLSGGASQGGKASATGGGIMAVLFGATGVASVATSIAMVGGAIATMANQIRMLEKAAEGAKTMKLLSFLSSWKGLGIVTLLGAVVSGITYLGDKLGWFTSEADKARASLEKLDGEYEEAKEKGDSVAAMLQRLYDQQGKLQQQSERDIFLREILTRFPEAAQFVDKLTLSFAELEAVLIRLNALEASQIAEASANKAKAIAKAHNIQVRDLGKRAFEDVKSVNYQGRSYLGSEQYTNLLNRMESSGFYSGINFDSLRNIKLERTSSAVRRSDVSELMSSNLLEGLRSSFNNNMDIKELSKVMADLKNAAAKLGDETLGKITNLVTDEISARIKQLSDANTSLMAKVTEKYAVENSKVNNNFSEASLKLADNIKDIHEETRRSITGQTEKVINLTNEWLREYKEQSEKSEDFDYLRDDQGNRRSLTSYSMEEFAKFIGVDTKNNPKALENLQQDLEEFVKSYNGTSEEAREAYAEARGRTNQLNRIIARMGELENAIRGTAYGKQQFELNYGDAYIKNAQKAYDKMFTAKNVKQAEESANAARSNYISATRASIAGKIKGKDILPFREELDKYKTVDSKIVAEAYQKIYGQDIKTEENFSKIAEDIRLFDINAQQLDKDLTTVKTKLSGMSPGIDTAQTGMESFFHKLNTDIKEIDMAYTNATRSMDQMLAAQQGVITGLERAYGSGSVAVKAEQVRLQKMQDAQLSKRNAALETKLSGYTQQLEILRSNPEYQQAKQLYDNAFAAWKKAEAGGDQKAINQTFRNLQTVSKGWDKLATKEESLTSKIADLQDEIIKNTEAINKENEERRINTNGGNPFTQIRRGFGDAATNYIDEAEKQGYGTLRGEAGIMGEGIIKSLDDSLVTLFDNITTKSKTAKESFKEFGQSIIQTIGDIAKQLLAKQIVMSLLGGMGSLFGGGEVTTSGGGWSSGFSNSALGGLVTGPIKNRDSVPTMLMPGEYVLKKSAVDSLGRDYLDSLNNKSATVMAGYSSEVTEAKSETTETGTQSGKGVVNVYVVAQEQQQQMTPQDVVVTITQDMITGGQTKKLVKSIAMGAI